MSVEELHAQLRDLAFQLPSGDPGTARLELLLMGLVQELAHLDARVERLVDEVLGDRRYELMEEIDDCSDTGADDGLPGPARSRPLADHDAGS